jgi:hypothetical protein
MIINFLPVATGGGLQNALSFISHLPRNNYLYFVREGSEIELVLTRLGFKIIVVKSGLLNRLIFELTARRYARKGEVCFTFFGPPVLSLIKYTYNINGFAYSNLLYPELNFWGFMDSKIQKFKKRLIDTYRKCAMSLCDELIYETDILYKRSLTDRLLKNCKSNVIKMSVSSLVSKTEVKPYSYLTDEISKLDGKKLLFLCGAQPNKRVKEFLSTLKHLNNGKGKFHLITTMAEESHYFKDILSKASDLKVNNFVFSIGAVEPDNVATLISNVDAVVNVALLESFSNNYIEAWKMEKPLIVTDSDWARDSCGNGALYIDVDNPLKSSLEIIELFNNPLEKVLEGAIQLKKYPTSKQKTSNYFRILNKKL